MGLTERHLFENEDVPENYEWDLEDAVYNSCTNEKPKDSKVGKVGISLEFVNKICPNCKNPNYMVSLGDFSKAYAYKCMNCNGYFNDIDFEKEPFQFVWKSKCMNLKADMVEVVRCKDCKWYDERISICDNCGLPREQTFFCADGKHKEGR